MKMAEQNISGVKLERMRKDAARKMKIQWKLIPVCLILFIGLALVKNRFFFTAISKYGWSDLATQGSFSRLTGDLMFSLVLVAVIFVFYYMLVFKKAYDRFCVNFKNKYVLDTLRQLPDFSELRYNAEGGLSYEEMNRLKLIPGGQAAFYQSSDELSGKLDGVPFRAVNVCTGEKASARSSTPNILFEGQVIVFSYFDNRKISEGFVQVFSKKALSKLRETRVPLSIQTENSVFNENFAVFAENEQNAFYILTPQVMEQITAFQEAMEGNVYLSFSEKSLYVTCSQLRNPFHIYIDIPVEEQRQRIAGDTAILCSAKELLIRAGQQSEIKRRS